MKNIAVEFTYHTDVIEVPDHIAINIAKVQQKFDKWLYDKSNNHGCWIVINGQKRAVSFDTSDFVNYINKYVLSDDVCKATIVHERLSKLEHRGRFYVLKKGRMLKNTGDGSMC